MAEEIFAFESVRRSNANLWWRTLAFHCGLYCLVAFVALQLAFATAGPGWPLMDRYVVAIGRVGLLLVVIGSLALLWRRATNVELRDYTHTADYIHLIAITITAGVLLFGSASAAAPPAWEIARALLTFNGKVNVPAALAIGLFLTFSVLAYVPYSHMAHFIAKYFTFHQIRWDDADNRGDRYRKAITKNLQLRPNWWAAHMGADGTKTWADIAAHNPSETKEVSS